MATANNSKTEGERKKTTDDGTAVSRASETLADNLNESAEAETVVLPVEDEKTLKAHPDQIDQVFTVLKNQRRRAVLRYLQTADEVELGTLAEQIAASECDKEVSQITSRERKRVYVGLYQSHLPKMEDVGAISYNKPRGIIEPGENRHLFEHYLPANTDDIEPARAEHYWVLPIVMGLSALMLALVWLLI